MANRVTYLLAAAAMATAAPALAGTNLLTNGSFESGNFSGWTVTSTGQGLQGYSDPVVIKTNQASNFPTGAFNEAIPTDNAKGNPSSDVAGNYVAYFSSDVGIQTLSQTVTLAPGQYSFGFDYYLPQNGYNNPNNATFSASLGGTVVDAFTLGSQNPVTWFSRGVTKTFNVTTPTAFTFTFAGSAYPAKDVAIDRVFLQTGGVPEPTAWAMMIGGFGLVGFAARRRRTRMTAVTA